MSRLGPFLWFAGVSLVVVFSIFHRRFEVEQSAQLVKGPLTNSALLQFQELTKQATGKLLQSGHVDPAIVDKLLQDTHVPSDLFASLAVIRAALTNQVREVECVGKQSPPTATVQPASPCPIPPSPPTQQTQTQAQQQTTTICDQPSQENIDALVAAKVKNATEEEKRKETDLQKQLDEARKLAASLKGQLDELQAQNVAAQTQHNNDEGAEGGWRRRWGEPNRSAHCLQHGDDSEACLYTSICDDGTSISIRDLYDDLPKRFPYRGVDYRYLEKLQRDEEKVDYLTTPYRVESTFQVVPDSDWDSFLTQHNNTIHVENAYFTVLFPKLSQGGNNIWHFTQSIAMLLDPQFHNETGIYPPMDVVVVRALGNMIPWTENMLKLMLPSNNTRVILIQEGQRVCGNTAMLLGYRRQLFTGREDGTRFRERVYERLGLDIHPKQHEFLSFPLRVKIFNRRDGRRIVYPASEDLKNLLLDNGGPEKYDVDLVGDLSKMPFVDQVQLWANTDLIIMPHGAGLANMIFARNHVPVIEVFPRHFYKETYRRIGEASNHPYFCLMSEKLSDNTFRANPADAINCEYWHGIDVMIEPRCHFQYLKYSGITLNETKFLDTVEMALEALPLEADSVKHKTWDPIRPANNPFGTPLEKLEG